MSTASCRGLILKTGADSTEQSEEAFRAEVGHLRELRGNISEASAAASHAALPLLFFSLPYVFIYPVM